MPCKGIALPAELSARNRLLFKYSQRYFVNLFLLRVIRSSGERGEVFNANAFRYNGNHARILNVGEGLMLIGIISDTHDDMSAIQKAVDIFTREGVSQVIHAGDLTSPFTFEIFNELKCTFTSIFGNNDGDRLLLKEKSGGTIQPQPHLVTLYGRRIVVLHEPDLVNALSDSGHFDLVVYGHTHRSDIRRVKDTLIINPGKAARLHKGESTLALLDMEKMEARIIPLL
jgi:putative phosphoesterase